MFVHVHTGAQLHYEDLGAPTAAHRLPVIALHGWLGTARHDLGALIDRLAAEGCRVLGPTRRGYGESLPKPRDYPDDFYHRDARDILAFMDALGIERAHLLGYSDGGETALVMAGTAPHRFASVGVWGALGVFGADMRPAVQRCYPATWMTDADKARNGITDADAYVLGWIRAMHAMIDAGGDVSLSLAPHITAPLRLMLGEHDTLNPRVYGDRFVAACTASPDARVVMFPCGHEVHQDAEPAFRATVAALLAHGEAHAG
jgi:valacyclovir hydrolase